MTTPEKSLIFNSFSYDCILISSKENFCDKLSLPENEGGSWHIVLIFKLEINITPFNKTPNLNFTILFFSNRS
jgi:hypothetical protein